MIQEPNAGIDAYDLRFRDLRSMAALALRELAVCMIGESTAIKVYSQHYLCLICIS
jgi:hypothetical protein